MSGSVSQCMPSSSIWSKMTSHHFFHTAGSKMRDDGKKGRPLPFSGHRGKLHTALRLTSHWPELSHMAIPSCKGGWEI